MEFGAATATLPKKLSSGYVGRSAYDGVFAAPVKLRAPSFSSRVEDYFEIFGSGGGSNSSGGGGRGGGSLGSSIPILELPELNEERSRIDEVRRSNLDYSSVFGGFRNLDGAVRFEELVAAEPKKKKQGSFVNGESTRSKANEGDQSCGVDSSNFSKETPVVLQSSNVAKRINMSYHRVNQGSENGTNGTTHIAQVHAVPAYTCLVEEVKPVKMNRTYKSIPAAEDTYSSNHFNEGIKEVGSRAGASADNAKKQSSNNGVKVNNRSDSIDLFFDACETSNGSNGTHHFNVPPLETMVGDKDIGDGDTMRTTATKCQASKSDTSEGAAHADSPSYLDDMVDSNSEAAASIAALRKAIEEAQLSLKVAKESLRRKKGGFPDRMKVKRKSTIDLKADVKQSVEVTHKTMKLDEIKMRQTFGETNALPQVSSEAGRPTMKEQVRSNIGAEKVFVAREAMQDPQEKLQSTKAEHKEEVEHKEADRSTKFLELKDVEINNEQLHNENTGCSADEKPEESDPTIEVVKGHWGQEKVHVGNEASACEELANETKHLCHEKISAGNEASTCEELDDETKHKYQEVVDETKLVQVTPESGTMDKRLQANEDGAAVNRVTPFHKPEDRKSSLVGQGLIMDKRLQANEDGEAVNRVAPFHEPEDRKSSLVGQGLMTGNEEQVSFKPENDGKRVEGSHDLEEDKRNFRAIEELSEVEKNIEQEQKLIEENVEVPSELEECELTGFLEPIDNEITCNPHGSDLICLEGEMQNIGCVEDRKKMDEADFLDKNHETEHSCQREGTKSMLSNVYVQKIAEEILDHTHDEEEIYERITKDSELDENKRVQDAKANENELEGGFLLMEETERGREDNKVPVEVIGVARIDPNYEKRKAEEAVKTTETSSDYELDETEKLINIQVADTIIENREALKVTAAVYSHDLQDDIMVASVASFQHQDKYEEPESVQETSDFCEKHGAGTSVSIQGAIEPDDAEDQMQSTSEAVNYEGDDTAIDDTAVKVRQNEDQCFENAQIDCNLAVHIEETTTEPVEICNDATEARVASNEEIDECQSNSSKEENLFGNEHDIEACQIPSTSEWKSSFLKEVEVKMIQSSLKENHQASATVEEKEVNANLQKLELEKEHLKKVGEVKEKGREQEREREKEKLAVERAIREARERAFADARERAALERAAAEARQKNIDGRERLGKSSGQANEKTVAEKAAMEAKLRAERAAVERATAEARARALERALSEKAASEARNKYGKSDQCFGASRDNGMKQNFHSKSFSYGEVRDSVDVFDGANGDSAQRCKARSERHQRIGERVAKALAEKNMRDRLVQKEQEERNRIAEALDADVRRWSSGKAGNLRALLSTLQYILGPDSGWQPIPLTEIVTTAAVKKAYRKATLFVHPDKLQQRGASIQQKYTCEKVFDLLKEAWNRFNMEER